MKKFIDAFIFYNECELLLLRFMELYDVVDYFVLVESNKTFRGNDKDLFFANKIKNDSLYKKYLDKTIHIIVDDMPETDDPWLREKHQRNSIHRGLKLLNLNEEDIVFVSDVDEIIDRTLILKLRNNSNYDWLNKPVALRMQQFIYNINYKLPRIWLRSYVVKYKNLQNDIDYMRLRSETFCIIKASCGWHLSYFGDIDFIKNKICNFSHSESEHHDKNDIINSINNSTFFLDNTKLDYIPLNQNTYYPKSWHFIANIFNIKYEN